MEPLSIYLLLLCIVQSKSGEISNVNALMHYGRLLIRNRMNDMTRAAENVRFQAQHAAMGTMYSIVAYAQPSVLLPVVVQHAFDEIDRLEALMSRYRPTSEICAVNRGAFGSPIAVGPELFGVLEEALKLSEETAGAFDVTVGALTKAWGFFRDRGRLPSQVELAHALDVTGSRHVKLNSQSSTVAFDNQGTEFDLGAIGKGYTVDRIVELLRAQGVSNALISSGSSSIAAIGAPPGERGWRISLCDPFDPRKEVRALRLGNLSISISGGYEQMFVLDGRTYTHLLDPRSGRPIEGVLMTAVIGLSNALNDALSTAFSVLGVEDTRKHLKQHPEITVLMFSPADTPRTVNQLVLASNDFPLPHGCVLEFEDA